MFMKILYMYKDKDHIYYLYKRYIKDIFKII